MKKTRVGLILGVVALMTVATGCSPATSNTPWAAKVNGNTITVADYDARMAAAQKAYESKGMKFDTDQGKQALTQLKTEIITHMVQSTMVSQEVKNLKLNTEDPAVTASEETVKKSMADSTVFQNTLDSQGMKETELKELIALYNKKTDSIKTPSEADIKNYFDKNKDKYGQAESVSAHHILVKTEDEAKPIIEQLKKAEADKQPVLPLFESIAKEKSTDPSGKQNGGDLGKFTKGQMVPEFEAVAFSQKAGTFTETPVKSQFGYHVIYVDAHTPASTPDFDKVKDQVAQDDTKSLKDTAFQTYMDNLRKNTKIDYNTGYEPKAQ